MGIVSRIEYDLPEKDYFAHEAINSSNLKQMLKSPRHYLAAATDDTEREPTSSQEFGRHLHAAVYEPDRYAAEFEKLPYGFIGRSKADLKLKADLKAAGKVPIKAEDADAIEACIASIETNPFARALRAITTHRETSIFWTDPQTKLECKARLDAYVAPCEQFPSGLIWDLKSTTDACERKFQRKIRDFHYDLSAAFYCDGFRHVHNLEATPAFYWIVIERKAPHAVAAYEPDEQYLARGRAAFETCLERIVQCRKREQWPSYFSNRTRTITPPAWDIGE